MENNQESNNRFAQFLQEKGYYIVLFLCICAIGVAGYVFISEAISEKEKEQTPAMSVVTTVEEAAVTQAPAQKANAAASEKAIVRTEAEKRVWPVSGQVQTEYCADVLCFNTTTQDWRTHEALDLSAQLGEQVHAAASGTVTAVYDDEAYGTTVTVSHDGGYTTTYANLAQMPEVSAGMEVSAGDVIGTVGDTALLECGQTPHLHFAVSYAGMSMDPKSFLNEQ